MMPDRIALLLSAVIIGCSPSSSKHGDPQLGANVVADDSQIQERHLIDFGGKVELLGFDLDAPEKTAPGSSFTLKMYWRRTGSLDGTWRLFTHLVNSNETFENFDQTGSLRNAAATPENWKLHQIYADVQTLKIPEKASREVTVRVGLWQGPLRLPILSGPHDSENRGIVVHLQTR